MYWWRRFLQGVSQKPLELKPETSLQKSIQKKREVVKGLGLRKLNSSVVRRDCPEVRGMIRKVTHLVKVEAVEKK